MKRRAFISGGTALSALTVLPARAAKIKKNIVLVVTDDQMLDTALQAMPKTKARAGITWFKNATAQAVVCEPSRAGIFTGQDDKRHGVINNPDDKRFRETDTLVTWLHGAGYRTGLVGKYFNSYPFGRGNYTPAGWDDWHAHVGFNANQWDVNMIENGINSFYPKLDAQGSIIDDNFGTRLFATKAIQFITDSVAQAKPFFLYFAPDSPHDPATIEDRYHSVFKTTAMPRPASFNGAPTNGPAWVAALPLLPAKTMDKARRTQWTATLSLDDAIDRIFNALQAQGVLNNTIVIFTTDQGRALGEHRWKTKRTLYDETVNVPFFTYGLPNVTGKEVVSLVDIAPTICAAVGVTPTIPQDGVPIRQRTKAYIRWIGGSASGKYSGSQASPAFDAIRTAQFKYAELPPSLLSPGEVELYDLLLDPAEMNNVAGKPTYAQARATLADELKRQRGF